MSKTWTWPVLALALMASSCALFDADEHEHNTNTDTSWIELGEVTSVAGREVHYYAQQDTLGTGYRPIKICVHNHAHPELNIQGLDVQLLPWMTMMSKSHAAPVENPGLTDAQGCAVGAVVWTMPSNSAEGWTLGVRLGEDSARLPVWVRNQDKVEMQKDPADTSKRILVAWVDPDTLRVGSQDVEFAVFRKESMSSFPVDTAWTFITMDPTMPSMGHGSPNNGVPVRSGSHYKGKVNMTMTGAWNIATKIVRGTDTLSLAWDLEAR
jgi:hypothetical protein